MEHMLYIDPNSLPTQPAVMIDAKHAPLLQRVTNARSAAWRKLWGNRAQVRAVTNRPWIEGR